MYDSVLLPTDASVSTDRAVEHALDAAQRYDATLHALYVVDVDTYTSYPGDEYVHELEGLESALERAGRDAIGAILDRAERAAVPAESAIRHGHPHREILAYADENDVGLLVVGSKNRPEEYRQLLGSVAERVVHAADRPVTVVKTPVDE